MGSANFLGSVIPLEARDAVCALLVLDDGRYLMQLRDDDPRIFYPGHWGLFGGALNSGETPLAALRRELAEELGLTPEKPEYFTRFEYDLGRFGGPRIYREFYLVRVKQDRLRDLVLGEGAAVKAFAPEALLTEERVVPYDAFALWLHHSGQRLAPRPGPTAAAGARGPG